MIEEARRSEITVEVEQENVGDTSGPASRRSRLESEESVEDEGLREKEYLKNRAEIVVRQSEQAIKELESLTAKLLTSQKKGLRHMAGPLKELDKWCAKHHDIAIKARRLGEDFMEGVNPEKKEALNKITDDSDDIMATHELLLALAGE